MQPSITIPTSADYKQWYDEDYYVDKTYIMSVLKNSFKSGSALFFARPRRWGKTLFLSTMQYFFDKNMYKEEYFKDKLIWKDEEMKKKAGKYVTFFLDLKPVYDIESGNMKFDELYISILEQLPGKYMKKIFGEEKPTTDIGLIKTAEMLKKYYKNTGVLIKKLVERLSKEEKIIIFIDEYDKPVNDCLKTKKNEKICKEILGKLKNNLFSHLKDIPATIIVTGVNKLSMASFFSEFNNQADSSNKVNVGFTQEEVKNLFNRLGVKYDKKLEKWYNGYNFGIYQEYNPWAIGRYIDTNEIRAYWSKTGTSPDYFKYLIDDVLKVKNLEEYMGLFEEIQFNEDVVDLEYMNDMNKDVILHYFYYAGLLSVDKEDRFFIPNNDVIESYKNLIFRSSHTRFYIELKTKLVDMLENWPEVKYIKDFIKFMLINKYNNQDKTSINENIIASDIALLMQTFSRNDIQRETNILPGRPDLIFIDKYENNNVVEFKVARKTEQVEGKIKEAKEQLEMYKKGGKYDRCMLIVIDLEEIEIIIDLIKN